MVSLTSPPLTTFLALRGIDRDRDRVLLTRGDREVDLDRGAETVTDVDIP